MGSAMPILDEIKTFAREAAEGLLSPEENAAAARGDFLASVERLATNGQDFKKRMEEIRAGLERFVEALSIDRRGVDLDEVVDTLRSAEQGMKDSMTPAIHRIKATRRGTFSLSGLTPGQRA